MRSALRSGFPSAAAAALLQPAPIVPRGGGAPGAGPRAAPLTAGGREGARESGVPAPSPAREEAQRGEPRDPEPDWEPPSRTQPAQHGRLRRLGAGGEGHVPAG